MPNLFAEGAFGFYAGSILRHRRAQEGAETLEDLRANGAQLTPQQQQELRNFRRVATTLSARLKKAYGIAIKSAHDMAEWGVKSIQSAKGVFSLVGGLLVGIAGSVKHAHTKYIDFPPRIQHRLGLN